MISLCNIISIWCSIRGDNWYAMVVTYLPVVGLGDKGASYVEKVLWHKPPTVVNETVILSRGQALW